MTWLSRFQTYLKSIPSRIDGSHIAEGETFTSLSTRARFPEADYLRARFIMARDLAGDRDVVADRKPEPKPVDYERELPIG